MRQILETIWIHVTLRCLANMKQTLRTPSSKSISLPGSYVRAPRKLLHLSIMMRFISPPFLAPLLLTPSLTPSLYSLSTILYPLMSQQEVDKENLKPVDQSTVVREESDTEDNGTDPLDGLYPEKKVEHWDCDTIISMFKCLFLCCYCSCFSLHFPFSHFILHCFSSSFIIWPLYHFH